MEALIYFGVVAAMAGGSVATVIFMACASLVSGRRPGE
jgi:hypothetical protein